MRDLSKLQIGLIVITTAIAVVFTLFFIEFHFGQRCALPEAAKLTKRCGNGFSNWLYDFQSLITGIFAVGAAWLTINQMKLSERKQSSHAEAAMALTIRSDFLKIERLCSYAVANLSARADDWRPYVGCEKLKASALYDKLLQKAWAFPDYWEYIFEVVNDDLFLEASPLFNSKTQRALKTLKDAVDELRDIGDFLFKVDQDIVDRKDIKDFFYHDFQFRADEVGHALSIMASLIERLHDELVVLEANYRVIANKSSLLRAL